MKTTIPINGLDVEFSDKKPTRAGAYWWSFGPNLAMPVSLNTTSSGLVVSWNNQNIEHWSGLWSTSPLVPAVEVEKAWQEGAKHGDQSRLLYERGGPNVTDADGYAQSRARRVVEGVS